MLKIDLKEAFLTCPVVEHDRKLLGFIWPPGAQQDCYYHYNVFPFGMRSSPKQFNILATALEYLMSKRGCRSSLLHYLDDYFCVCPTYDQA